MQNEGKRVVPAAALLACGIMFLLASCGGGDSGSQEGEESTDPSAAQSEHTAQSEANNGRPSRTLTFGEERSAGAANDSPSSEENSESPQGSPTDTRERSFLAAEETLVRPEDMVIGPLYMPGKAEGEERRVYAAAQRFFTALQSGRNPAELLHPDVRKGLAERLEREMGETTIASLRYGKVRVAEEEARMNVRLFGEPGRSAGELVFWRLEGIWYIAAADLVFSSLGTPYEVPERQRDGGRQVSPLNFY